MKKLFAIMFLLAGTFIYSQDNVAKKATFHGTITSMEYVTSIASRSSDLRPSDNSVKEAKDKRSIAQFLNNTKNKPEQDDYFVKNRNEKEQSVRMAAASLSFDAYTSGSQPTDPSLAIGPNHVFVVYNTGFTIYNKSGTQLLGQTAPNPAIFPSSGCCDLTVSYDNLADRWVLTFLGNGAQVAVSDGPDPLTSGWYVYNISAISDYQKLSVWSDGYYITENTGSSNKVWALERDAMLEGDSNAQIVSFELPGLVTSGFHSPQALNITDNTHPAPGGATVVYMQDDAWNGVSNDHIKLWTINVDWNNAGNSTVSAVQEISTTPFIGVFDNGSFSNLKQPGGGRPIRIDALQATIMNQAQFRKFTSHNSAVFNFVVNTSASGEVAGVRWYEFRQDSDNQPWSLYQEGTYTAPDDRHAWNASLAMDGQGNIGMGYTSMSSEISTSTIQVSSYFTGRTASDPLGVMTAMEGLIANGNAKIPGTRYGDYSKIDVDPADDSSFWFINEYMNGSRRGVVGKFQIQGGGTGGDTEAPTNPTNLIASNITSNSATLNWTASNDNVGVTQYNVSIDGTSIGTSATTSFNVTELTALTIYNASITAQDAAANTSGSASTSFTTIAGGTSGGEIAAYYFETGLQGWTDGGNDCARQSTSSSYEGSYSIKLRDGSTTSNAVSPVLDLTEYSQVSIELHTYANSMENGENFLVEFYNGNSYQVIGDYTSGTDFNNRTFFSPSLITLNSDSYSFNTNNRIRVLNNANSNNDQIYFDQVIITGELKPTVANNDAITTSTDAELAKDLATSNNIKLYPNPANESLNIQILEGNFDEIMIFSSTGQVIKTITPKADRLNIDVSKFSSGIYFVRFTTGKLAVTKRFIKN
jgi:hypothetical protein